MTDNVITNNSIEKQPKKSTHLALKMHLKKHKNEP